MKSIEAKTDVENNLSLTNETLINLYTKPLPASRTGALYNAFSYPTKISPESIAVFIASHTKPGDTVLDTFGGSGTTGIAAQLCSKPTKEVIKLAEQLNAPAVWGPRNAIIYELGALGSFVAKTMNEQTDPKEFIAAAEDLISSVQKKLGNVYSAVDDEGKTGTIRHTIWSDILKCPACNKEIPYWDVAVQLSPLKLKDDFTCPECHYQCDLNNAEYVFEEVYDQLLDTKVTRKKRVIKRIYGQTGKRKWQRAATEDDHENIKDIENQTINAYVPVEAIPWGDLYRSGYHKGITHAHHFYTPRNLVVMAELWQAINLAPRHLQNALKLLVLSYNASHATLMTRVVVKKNQKDFVLTGAQTGVLYISSLPVEKNLFEGIKRKVKTLSKAFEITYGSQSNVKVINGSSTSLDLPDQSVDYVFTDPPFGDYIPYAELNFLNEVWLGSITDRKNEIIISPKQNKTVSTYSELMRQVFKEISRTLKADGLITVVFHSAKAGVWKALQDSYVSSGLKVQYSSVLDKLQGSFKQVTSSVSVKGDPLLLLTKGSTNLNKKLVADEIISDLIRSAALAVDKKEFTVERIYTRFISKYLEVGLEVPMDADEFYKKVRPLIYQASNVTNDQVFLKAKRQKRLGQYFTDSKLATLLATIAEGSRSKKVIDPMCGQGDMLTAVKNINHSADLYGIDIDSIVIEKCNERFGGSFPGQILSGNAFNWNTVKRLDTKDFDLVITNPPYVRYQSLNKDNELFDLPSSESIRGDLLEVALNMPGLSSKERELFITLIKNYSGLSDLAVPSWILCAMLTSIGGHLAIIVPESWLSRDYAHPIQYLLVKLFKIKWIIEDLDRCWFNDAQVKTNLVVAERIPFVENIFQQEDTYIHVSLPSSVSDSESIVGDLFSISDKPEKEFLKVLNNIRNQNKVELSVPIKICRLNSFINGLLSTLANYKWFRQVELTNSSVANLPNKVNPRGVKVPQELLDVLMVSDIECSSLQSMGWSVGQGLRTGANTFFYCDLIEERKEYCVVKTHKSLGSKQILIPNDSLLPVLRRQNEVSGNFLLNQSELKGRVLFLEKYIHPQDMAILSPKITDVTVEEFNRRVMPKELARFIELAAGTNIGTVENPKFIPNASAVRTNISKQHTKDARFWYTLPSLTGRHKPELFVPRINNLHPKTMLNDNETVIDANFSTFWVDKESKIDRYAMLALLNSLWAISFMELTGSIMGGGALKLEATHIKYLPIPILTNDQWQQVSILGRSLIFMDNELATLKEIDTIIIKAVTGSNQIDSVIESLNNIIIHKLASRSK